MCIAPDQAYGSTGQGTAKPGLLRFCIDLRAKSNQKIQACLYFAYALPMLWLCFAYALPILCLWFAYTLLMLCLGFTHASLILYICFVYTRKAQKKNQKVQVFLFFSFWETYWSHKVQVWKAPEAQNVINVQNSLSKGKKRSKRFEKLKKYSKSNELKRLIFCYLLNK